MEPPTSSTSESRPQEITGAKRCLKRFRLQVVYRQQKSKIFLHCLSTPRPGTHPLQPRATPVNCLWEAIHLEGTGHTDPQCFSGVHTLQGHTIHSARATPEDI